MIGEMCSSGSGQRIRNSYGNIHGYHSSRCQFGSNRAVSLDQYSTNNRRLSDGLQQVISDSNVFYNHQNRESTEITEGVCRLVEDLNMNATGIVKSSQTASLQVSSHTVPNIDYSNSYSTLKMTTTAAVNLNNINISSNGNLSPTQTLRLKQHYCAAAATVEVTASSNDESFISVTTKNSWKTRFKQFSNYLGFSFDKGSKRFGSTRSSPCFLRNNNATTQGTSGSTFDPLTGTPNVCCTISNNLQSPNLRHKHSTHQDIINTGRLRAYSLDVPCSRTNPHYSSSSGGGGDSSRKSSRYEGPYGDDNNSNNTLHSSGGVGSEMPTCPPPPIRIGSVDASDTILIATDLPRVITPANLGEAEPSLSIDLGMVSASSSDPPKI